MTFVSNVCRVAITEALATLAKPGITPIPTDVLAPRQVKVTNTSVTFPATMTYHRDAFVPTVSRATAELLVENGEASWAEQSLLCYSMEDYLADNDVKADEEELSKAQAAADAGVDVVVVAIIGDNRSPLSVCRNIVSGCIVLEDLEADAAGAVEAADVFLVE